MYVTINGWNGELLFVSTLPVHALQKLKKTQGAFANNDSAAGLAFAFFSVICWSHMAGLTSTTRVSARIAQLPQHFPVGLHFHEESTSILICISVMAVNFCHSSSFVGLLFCRLLQNSNSWDASLMPRVLCNCFSVFGLILFPMLHCHT